MLSDIVPVHDLGKTMGIAMSFVTAGIVGGPMVGGTMFQLFGYWPAWSVPLIVLVLDIIARLIMIEPRTLQPSPSYSGKPDSTPGETTGLLSGTFPVTRKIFMRMSMMRLLWNHLVLLVDSIALCSVNRACGPD